MQSAEDLLQLGHQAMARQAWTEALACFQAALGVQPDFSAAWQGGGVALRRLGRREDALDWLDRAIPTARNPAVALNTRGNVLLDLRRYDEALAAFDLALAAEPRLTLAHLGRGYAFMGLQRPADALAAYDAAGEIDPAYAEAWQWGGKAAVQLGLIAAALARFERARAISPDVAVDLDIGNAWLQAGRADRALAEADRVLADDPEQPRARYLRAIALLSQGRYREGWRDYEYRLDGGQVREVEAELAARSLLWPTAEQLTGRSVLLVGGQGIGDMIMFASLIPELMQIAPRVTLACDARLHGLFANSFPGLRLLPRPFRKGEVDAHDVTVLLSSLGGVFRNAVTDFSGQAYLRPTDAAVRRWAERLGPPGGRRIGISWRGGHASTGAALRTVDPVLFASALAAPGRELISLQYGDVAADAAALGAASLSVRVFPAEEIDDFDDLAGLIASLDGVASVQTAVVHLCGAIGARCQVLLPEAPEWRYAADRTRMPWYGSIALHHAGPARAEALRRISAALG